MEKIRAKFQCQSVTNYGGSEEVRLTPVVGADGNEENKSFSKYTPSGELKMLIDNLDTRGFFIPNKEYYLDITKAE